MKEQRTTNIEHRTLNYGEPKASSKPKTSSAGRVFDLEDRLLEFASVIIDISEDMPKTRAGNHVAGQLLRSGTSPYSNHGEAESAESSDDFIHKMKICLKELRETRRWLKLIHQKSWLGARPEMQFALSEAEELIRIFVASIRTAKRNSGRASASFGFPQGRLR